VLANGDVVTPADVASLARQTGAAGVMIGRGAIGNPWIFGSALAGDPEAETALPDPALRLRTLERHVELVNRTAADPEARTRELRRYAAAYSRGLPGGRHFRVRAMAVREPEDLVALTRDFLSGAGSREAA
jgi:tRNA-dihydrouridine synthase